MSKKFVLIVLVTTLSMGGLVFYALYIDYFSNQDVRTDLVPEEWITTLNVATTTTDIRDYTIEFISTFGEKGLSPMKSFSKVLILKNNRIVFEAQKEQDFGGFYDDGVGDWIKNADDLKRKAVKDVTGDGTPELILIGYSGGSHCCFHNYVIELSDPLSILLDLDTGDYGIQFVDLNHDGIMEIETYDSVFSYWNTSFGASPMPSVVLNLQRGKYKADPALMRKPPPTEAVVRKMANAVESWSGSQGPEVAWKYAIDLIYSGNITSARTYVNLSWRNNGSVFKSKDDFWDELKGQIQKSPYYSDLSGHFGL